jgi:flagellar basal-body rod protein FlgG
VDVIANNLANVNTSGFKRALMQIESAPKTTLYRDQIDPGTTAGKITRGVAVHAAIGDLGFGSRIYDTPTVFDQGPIEQTGNPLDIALSGPGFLSVRDAAGTVSYVRGGSFTPNAQGTLVTAAGDAVLDTNRNPITIPAQGAVQIDRAGVVQINNNGVVAANAVPLAQLAVVEFGDLASVRPQGDSKFTNAGAAPLPAVATSVLQGAQEKSNANVVSSMVDLIANERWFDANEKMISTQDTEVGAAINAVGKSTP